MRLVVSLGRVRKGMLLTIRPLSPSKCFSVHYLCISQWICVSLIGLLLGYMLDGVRTFVRLRKMSIRFVAFTASGTTHVPRASCPIITGSSFTVGVQAGLPLSSIMVEDAWSYTSSLQYVFTCSYLIEIDKFLSANSSLHPP